LISIHAHIQNQMTLTDSVFLGVSQIMLIRPFVAMTGMAQDLQPSQEKQSKKTKRVTHRCFFCQFNLMLIYF